MHEHEHAHYTQHITLTYVAHTNKGPTQCSFGPHPPQAQTLVSASAFQENNLNNTITTCQAMQACRKYTGVHRGFKGDPSIKPHTYPNSFSGVQATAFSCTK